MTVPLLRWRQRRVGAFSSAFAVDIIGPAWLSFCRSSNDANERQ
jgi:hypothetical protein